MGTVFWCLWARGMPRSSRAFMEYPLHVLLCGANPAGRVPPRAFVGTFDHHCRFFSLILSDVSEYDEGTECQAQWLGSKALWDIFASNGQDRLARVFCLWKSWIGECLRLWENSDEKQPKEWIFKNDNCSCLELGKKCQSWSTGCQERLENTCHLSSSSSWPGHNLGALYLLPSGVLATLWEPHYCTVGPWIIVAQLGSVKLIFRPSLGPTLELGFPTSHHRTTFCS